jgi:hypothetical protein
MIALCMHKTLRDLGVFNRSGHCGGLAQIDEHVALSFL